MVTTSAFHQLRSYLTFRCAARSLPKEQRPKVCRPAPRQYVLCLAPLAGHVTAMPSAASLSAMCACNPVVKEEAMHARRCGWPGCRRMAWT